MLKPNVRNRYVVDIQVLQVMQPLQMLKPSVSDLTVIQMQVPYIGKPFQVLQSSVGESVTGEFQPLDSVKEVIA